MTSTWVLILTMIYGGGGASVTPVSGFPSYASCASAGDAWLAQLTNQTVSGARKASLCVEQVSPK